MKAGVLIALLLILPAGLLAADSQLVEQALENMESEQSGDWAFTQTTLTDGKTSVTTYEPGRPDGERWELVNVEGREPTAAELKRVERQNRRDVERRKMSDEDESGESQLNAMIEPGTLSLIEESSTHAAYSFTPGAESKSEKKMLSHVDGRIEVLKAGPTISSIELKSREPFSPAFGVKISEFHTHLTFEPPEEGGPALPRTVSTKVEGRAFMVKKVNEDVMVTFSDWTRVTP